MKKMLMALGLALLSLNALAEGDDSIVFSGEVGSSKVLDWDANATLNAVAANAGDFAELTSEGRFLQEVKIEILPSFNPDRYSNVTRYTLTSSERGSILGSPRPLKKFQLVLDSYWDKRIMDDVPTIWRSSGVYEVRQ